MTTLIYLRLHGICWHFCENVLYGESPLGLLMVLSVKTPLTEIIFHIRTLYEMYEEYQLYVIFGLLKHVCNFTPKPPT